MNLKYYLRGLGIGIIVTALIMGIATSGKKETLSDSEIIERAKALGMTEEGTLIEDVTETSKADEEEKEEAEILVEQPDSATAGEEESEPAVIPEPTDDAASQSEAAEAAAVAESTPATVVTPEPTEAPQPTEAPTPVPTPEPEEDQSQDTEFVTIQINSGDGSYSACIQLEEAGLIESATTFDRYLYDNGYDKRINVGIFEIPRDAEPEQIARILARQK